MAMLTEARQLVEKVATGNRILAKSGLADAIRISVGHVSARIPNTDLIISQRSGLPGAIAMWHYYEEQVRL